MISHSPLGILEKAKLPSLEVVAFILWGKIKIFTSFMGFFVPRSKSFPFKEMVSAAIRFKDIKNKHRDLNTNTLP